MRRRACMGAALPALLILACSTYNQADFLDYAPSKGLILPAPPADQAQIVFFPTVHEGTELAVYEDGNFLVPLLYYTCHVHRTTPGPHRYGLVGRKNAEFAEGELEGGATYLMLAHQTYAGRYALRPVLPRERHTTLSIADWIKLCIRVEPNAETRLWRQEREPALETRRLRDLDRWRKLPPAEQARITREFALRRDVVFVTR